MVVVWILRYRSRVCAVRTTWRRHFQLPCCFQTLSALLCPLVDPPPPSALLHVIPSDRTVGSGNSSIPVVIPLLRSSVWEVQISLSMVGDFFTRFGVGTDVGTGTCSGSAVAFIVDVVVVPAVIATSIDWASPKVTSNLAQWSKSRRDWRLS